MPLSSCSLQQEGVPDGAVARVGTRVFEQRDLEALTGQLESYGQLRFSQEGGQRALLMALIAGELLAQTAQDAGYADDPRVAWALIEEAASMQLLAEMERVVPYREVADDTAALREEYERDRASFLVPERRSFEGVTVDNVERGEQLLERLKAGEGALEEFGEILRTRPQARDDDTLPGFSPVLFTEGLQVGQLLPHPVIIGTKVYVGRLESRTPARAQEFADPTVQERLVNAVRARRIASAREQYMRSLFQTQEP